MGQQRLVNYQFNICVYSCVFVVRFLVYLRILRVLRGSSLFSGSETNNSEMTHK
jgi:hypothetical protein